MPPLEIVGADEIVGDEWLDVEGDDDDDLEGYLGAKRRRKRGGARMTALAVKAAQGAALVKSEGPTEARELLIGLTYLAVAAGATVQVTTRPQKLFRPTRLVVASLIAPFFTVEDIKVGNASQFVASGPVPAESFSQTAFNTPLKLDTVQISMDLIVIVTNIDVAPRDFRATFFGNAVY